MILKILRLERGLRQKDLGKLIGVSQQTISDIENGSVNSLTLGDMEKLSKLFKINEADLYLKLIQYRK